MALEQYPNLTEQLREIGLKIRDEYKELLKTPDKKGRNAIASGKLYDSIEYKLTMKDNMISLYFVAEDYWVNVEYGRESFNEGSEDGIGSLLLNKMPPINAIRKWILNKKLNRTKNIEYKIQRSITRNGIKARPFLKQVSKNLIIDYKELIEKALTKDIELLIEKEIKTSNVVEKYSDDIKITKKKL